MGMELRILRYFLTVVREENISRAAETLHVTQPTLSRQISQLEEEVGAPLFVRGKHLVLTNTGMLVRRRAEEVVALMDKMESELKEQEEIEGTITIGSGGQYGDSILPEVMERFRDCYPHVNFDFYTNNADNIKERLDHGLLDFAMLLEPVDVSQYDYVRLKDKTRWGLLVQKEHTLARFHEVPPEAMLGIPLIMTNRASLQKELANWFGVRIEQLNIFATYDVITNVAALVERGYASALTIESAVHVFDPRKLCFLPLKPEMTMHSVFVWKKFSPMFGAAEKFLDFFKSIHFEHTSV